MKKLIAAVLSLCILGGALPVFSNYAPDTAISASAEASSGTCGENLTWTLDDEGTLTISGTGDMYDYDNGGSPFYENTDIKKIVIESGVTSIGGWAFSWCDALESVTIGNSVTSIGEGAFYSCSSLESITIPDSVTSIGDYAFYNCKSLESITIPDSVTSIGDFAFSRSDSLESITILNPDCEIYDSEYTICSGWDDDGNLYFDGIIYGYEGSTAQAYAEKYGYTFESLGEAPAPETTYGDANENDTIEMADAVLILQSQSNPDKYGVNGTAEGHITSQGEKNADCTGDGDGVTASDALAIQRYILKLIDFLPEK